MNKLYSKLAAGLAAIIGLMAIVSGGRVLLGELPDYYLIAWLPVYNFTIGLLSAGVTSVLLWRNSRYAGAAALATLALHTTVMIILQTAYQDVVATESIRAMTIRIMTWLVIQGLLLLQWRRDRVRIAGSRGHAL